MILLEIKALKARFNLGFLGKEDQSLTGAEARLQR
jgi:hypothetical protein